MGYWTSDGFDVPRTSFTGENVAGSLGRADCCGRMLVSFKESRTRLSMRAGRCRFSLGSADATKFAAHARGPSVGSQASLVLLREQRDGEGMGMHNYSN